MTRIALIGYGAMGRELERLAGEFNCEVVRIHDVDRPLTSDGPDYDVAIEFTEPSVVLENARLVAESGKDIVIGTTGWYDDIEVLEQIQQRTGQGIIFGSNFSVGVQMFFRLARAAGMLVNDAEEYDVMVHEWHHARKKDSPSGTAFTTAQILLDEIDRKERMDAETQHERIHPEVLHVSSTRGGNIIGRHLITIDGPTDSIEIQHTARSREGFARGALRAARWIHGRSGLFDFADVFSQIIASEHS